MGEAWALANVASNTKHKKQSIDSYVGLGRNGIRMREGW